MGSIDQPSSQTVYSKGIYHGLPDLSYAPRGMTAVVTGANGISGAHMIRVLAEDPERWTKIYALSRRPPSGTWPKTVEHIPLDFLKSPEQIAKVLQERNIKPDYVFFFSYVLVVDDNGALQWGDQRLVDKNSEFSFKEQLRPMTDCDQISSYLISWKHYHLRPRCQNVSFSNLVGNGTASTLGRPIIPTKRPILA